MDLICIMCPRGCLMTIEKDDEQNWKVEGYICGRGWDYAVMEASCPQRTLTTSVWVEGGEHALVSARTDKNIPKSKIFEALEQVRHLRVRAPIEMGDVLIANIAGSDADLVATRRVGKLKK